MQFSLFNKQWIKYKCRRITDFKELNEQTKTTESIVCVKVDTFSSRQVTVSQRVRVEMMLTRDSRHTHRFNAAISTRLKWHGTAAHSLHEHDPSHIM